MSNESIAKTAPAKQDAATSNTAAQTFNPFTALSTDELTALAGSFNKAWRDAHSMDIALAQTEFSISENDATFYAWIKSEAVNVLDRTTANTAAKFISNMLEGVAFPHSSATSLGLIAGKYNDLKVNLRKSVGIKVRDYACGRWANVTANAILEKVYLHLGITEKDWMR